MQSFRFRALAILVLTCQVGRPLASNGILNLDNKIYRLVRNDGSTTEGPPGSGNSTVPPSTNTNGTTGAECERNRNCCAMYTWPGNKPLEHGDDLAPRICDDLDVRKRDRLGTSFACFDPLIYSTSQHGFRPDPCQAIATCIENEYPCFCRVPSDGVCLKLSFMTGETTVNETRFCGTLTNVVSGTFVTSGCYREKIEGTGYTREVCACELTAEGYCNSAPRSIFISFTFLFISFLIRCLH